MSDASSSPRPWRVEEIRKGSDEVYIASGPGIGQPVITFVSRADAELIVDAVNAYDRVAANLGELDNLKKELEEAKAHASSLRWLVHLRGGDCRLRFRRRRAHRRSAQGHRGARVK